MHSSTFRCNLALIVLNLNKGFVAMRKRSVADLTIGEKAVIHSFNDESLSLKLLEMGCLPGAEVQMSGKAPMGDPICLNVAGYRLAIRKSEAATIIID